MSDTQGRDEDFAPVLEEEYTEDVEEQATGLDPAVAQQLTLQVLSNAVAQQQLNSALDRNQIANACNVLTLGVQMNYSAALLKLAKTGPMEAAAFENLLSSGTPSRVATLNAATQVPTGIE